LEECGPCPVFAGFTLAFALQLRKKHGKTSVRVVKHTARIHGHNNKNTYITLSNRNKAIYTLIKNYFDFSVALSLWVEDYYTIGYFYSFVVFIGSI
jgi:hypothetical protein